MDKATHQSLSDIHARREASQKEWEAKRPQKDDAGQLINYGQPLVAVPCYQLRDLTLAAKLKPTDGPAEATTLADLIRGAAGAVPRGSAQWTEETLPEDLPLAVLTPAIYLAHLAFLLDRVTPE